MHRKQTLIRESGTGCHRPGPGLPAVRKSANTLFAGLAALLFANTALALETELVPTTADSTPFFSAVTDLAANGYTEEEYFVSGEANIYEYDDDLNLQIQVPDVPYTTRILIRRPENPADFNGVVVFEMMNPTATFDIDFMWQYTQDFLLRQGYIWVGMTIRENAVGSLKAFDPIRYAPINLVERGLSYDAYGDIAGLLQDEFDPENPLADFHVHHMLGTGYSQSEDWLTTFSNELHESKLGPDGEPAFDGYLGAGGNGAARGIWSGDPEAEFGAFYSDERRFNDVDAPYFRIQTETEVDVFTFSAVNTRQPDSNIFRQWEVAGSAHADEPARQTVSATMLRDLGFGLPTCNAPTGDVAMAPFMSAALHQLTRWVRWGITPPPSRYLDWDGTSVNRDADGNALGGIRIPEVVVPIGTYIPFNSGPPGTPCVFTPSFEQFSQERLDQDYPRNSRYVNKVRRAALDLRRDGYLLPIDVFRYVRKAYESDIGR